MNRCREFDLFCYKTILKVLYDEEELKEAGAIPAMKYLVDRQKRF